MYQNDQSQRVTQSRKNSWEFLRWSMYIHLQLNNTEINNLSKKITGQGFGQTFFKETQKSCPTPSARQTLPLIPTWTAATQNKTGGNRKCRGRAHANRPTEPYKKVSKTSNRSPAAEVSKCQRGSGQSGPWSTLLARTQLRTVGNSMLSVSRKEERF